MIIDEIVIEYLSKVLDEPVFKEKPKNIKRYVLVQRSGRNEKDKLYNASFIFQSYAESLFEAASLNERVIKAMENMVTLSIVSASKHIDDYEYTNTQTKEYRYQAIFGVYY